MVFEGWEVDESGNIKYTPPYLASLKKKQGEERQEILVKMNELLLGCNNVDPVLQMGEMERLEEQLRKLDKIIEATKKAKCIKARYIGDDSPLDA